MPSNNFVYRGTKKIISTMEDVENKSSILCGSFKTMFGNIGTTYHLWRHENFDEAQALRTMWISNQASNFIDFSKYYTRIPGTISTFFEKNSRSNVHLYCT